MKEIQSFKLFSESNPEIMERLQPKIPLRQWGDVDSSEKLRMIEILIKNDFLGEYPEHVVFCIEELNDRFKRITPGDDLHHHQVDIGDDHKGEEHAARIDFQRIFVHADQDLVFEMLSIFADSLIDKAYVNLASKEQSLKNRAFYLVNAYKDFDKLEKCLNDNFVQFCVNMSLSREGFIPRQDNKIEEEIYRPTLQVLSDPKWKSVSDQLQAMFNDYRAQNYPEVITKASSAVHGFLQILVGEAGKNGKGEYGKLFTEAREKGIISNNRFIEGIITTIKGFLPGERASKSTAKPAKEQANSSDALLVMNVVMVLIQHCLQNLGEIKEA
ncbi:MAG: hypothetical protein OXC42_06900 [Gammaproteobacteria bacterium]|nr:hypothetical protein [Gammaproteobacteria bacterium]